MVRLIVSSLACVLIAFLIAWVFVGEQTVSTASFSPGSDSTTAAALEADTFAVPDFDGQVEPRVDNLEWRNGNFDAVVDALMEASANGRPYSKLLASDNPGPELLVAGIAGSGLDLVPLMYASARFSEPLALWGAGAGAAAPVNGTGSGAAPYHDLGGNGGYGGFPVHAFDNPEAGLTLPPAGIAGIPAADERGLSGGGPVGSGDGAPFRSSHKAPGGQSRTSETTPHSVPEPMSLVLFGTGTAGLMLLRRRLPPAA